MSGGSSGTDGLETHGSRFLMVMNINKQNRHIPGTREYDPLKSPINLVDIHTLDNLIKNIFLKVNI